MHVAVVGAGALGVVYGALLRSAGATVTFVVRSARASETTPFVIERVDGDLRGTVDAPTRSATVPSDADVIVVCVRAEQLDDALFALLLPSSAPVVLLTPLMPQDVALCDARLGAARVVPAMPSVVSYARSSDGVIRYWLPHVATTLVEEPPPPARVQPEVEELVRCLVASGIGARTELGVRETNPATTVSFIPIAMGVDAAGGIDALLDDSALLNLTLDAAREGIALGEKIGKPAAWASLLMKFVGPFTLKVGVGLARRRSQEAVDYVETHFGRKLHAQNVSMAGKMIELAREHGIDHAAMTKLFARLAGEQAGSTR